MDEEPFYGFPVVVQHIVTNDYTYVTDLNLTILEMPFFPLVNLDWTPNIVNSKIIYSNGKRTIVLNRTVDNSTIWKEIYNELHINYV
jgi:hypothetical protein